MRMLTAFFLFLSVATCFGQALSESSFENQGAALHGVKSVWLELSIDDNMKGNDLREAALDRCVVDTGGTLRTTSRCT